MAISQLTSQSQNDLKLAIGKRESGNNYQQGPNRFGYVGYYQFGAQALESVGYLNEGAYQGSNSATRETKNWAGPPNAPASYDEYINSPAWQEKGMDSLLTQNYNSGINTGAIKSGSSQEELGGFLSAAHIAGAGPASKYVTKGINSADGNGTTTSSYYGTGFKSVDGNNPPGSPPPAASAGSSAISNGAASSQVADSSGPGVPPISQLDPSITNEINDSLGIINDDSAGSLEMFNTSKTPLTGSSPSSTAGTGGGSSGGPRPNPLMDFSTMTYSISLYVLTPAQYNKLLTSGDKDVNGFTLFLQSGGAPTAGPGLYGATRSQFFQND